MSDFLEQLLRLASQSQPARAQLRVFPLEIGDPDSAPAERPPLLDATNHSPWLSGRPGRARQRRGRSH